MKEIENIKEIKATTKKAQRFIAAYNNSSSYRLFDCYKVYSREKEEAYIKCLEKSIVDRLSSMKVIAHNTFQFTVMWPNKRGYRVETRHNSYQIVP